MLGQAVKPKLQFVIPLTFSAACVANQRFTAKWTVPYFLPCSATKGCWGKIGLKI